MHSSLSLRTVKPKKTVRKDFFNDVQREELKKKMIERLIKAHGKANADMIKEEVQGLFNSGVEINSTSIWALENKIKKNAGPDNTSKSMANNLNTDENLKMVADSIMAKSQSESDLKLPLIMAKSKLQENPTINYTNEEERWGTVYKYNTYVYKQELKLERIRAEQKRQRLKKILDEQTRENERKAQKNHESDISYMNASKRLREIEQQNDDTKKQYLKDKITFQKEMRRIQMEENEKKRLEEIEKEKLVEAETIKQIQLELRKEKEEAEELKNNKLKEMRRVMDENAERKIILAQQREVERLENIELQKKAIQISEALEKRRADEIKARDDAIANIIKSSEGAVLEIRKKNEELEYRNQRYEQLRDKCLNEKEKRDIVEEQVRKDDLKKFLHRQMEDKKTREEEEKKLDDDQAKVWRSEKEQFEKFTNDRKAKKADTFKNYREELKKQMDDKERREAEMAALKITANEGAMNKLLLQKVQELQAVEDKEMQVLSEIKNGAA